MRGGRALLCVTLLGCLPILAVQGAMGRWWGPDSTLPGLPVVNSTPVDEGSVVLPPYHLYCGTDQSGVAFCVMTLNMPGRLFPALFQVVAPLPTPAPTFVPSAGGASPPGYPMGGSL